MNCLWFQFMVFSQFMRKHACGLFKRGRKLSPKPFSKIVEKYYCLSFQNNIFKINDCHDVLFLYDVIRMKPFTCLLTNFNLLFFFNFGQKKCKIKHKILKGKGDNKRFAEVSPFCNHFLKFNVFPLDFIRGYHGVKCPFPWIGLSKFPFPGYFFFIWLGIPVHVVIFWRMWNIKTHATPASVSLFLI